MNEIEEDKLNLNTCQSEGDNFIFEKGYDVNQKNDLNCKKISSSVISYNSPTKKITTKSIELINSSSQNEYDQQKSMTNSQNQTPLKQSNLKDRKKYQLLRAKQMENRNNKSIFFPNESDDNQIFKQNRTSLSQFSMHFNKQMNIQKSKQSSNQLDSYDIDNQTNKRSVDFSEQIQHKKYSVCQKISFYLKVFKAVRLFKSFLVSSNIHPKVYRYIKDQASFHSSNDKSLLLPFSQKQIQFISRMFKQNYKLKKKLKAISKSFNAFQNSIFQFLDKYLPIFDPINKWKLMFDIFIIYAILFGVFINTIEVFFQIQFLNYYPIVYPIIDWTIFYSLFLDILVKFNTGIYDYESIQSDRQEIFRSYYKSSFIFDIISMLSFVRVESEKPIVSNIFGLLILFRIEYKLKIMQSIAHANQKYMKTYYVIQLIRLVIIILFVAHFVAIIFYGQILATQFLNIRDDINWVTQGTLVTMDDEWYIFSLYFSVTTMMTVGYGDITPKNYREAIIGIISMVIACGVFAYSFNLIGCIIDEMNRKEEQFKEQMKKVHIYLSDRNIDQDLKYQVHRHLEFRYLLQYFFKHEYYQLKYKNVNSLSKEEEDEVLQGLSANLLQKINFQTKSKILNKANKIFNHFSTEMRDQLCLKLKEYRTNKEEIIFEQESLSDNPEMYFIHRGCIEIYYKNQTTNKESILNVLQDGSYFGEMSFFTNQLRISSARSKESSVIFSLSRQDFLIVLEKDKQELEKYHLIYSKLVFGKSNQYISQNCYFCNKDSHMTNKCPQLHYEPDKELIILKNSFSTPIKQRKQHHRLNKKQKSLKLYLDVNEEITLLRQNNFFYDDDILSDAFINFDNKLRYLRIDSDTPKGKNNIKHGSYREAQYSQDVLSSESLNSSYFDDQPQYSQIDEEDDESRSSKSKSSKSSSQSSNSTKSQNMKKKTKNNQLQPRSSFVDSFNSIPDEEGIQKSQSQKSIGQEGADNKLNKYESLTKKQVVNKVRHKTVKQTRKKLDFPQITITPEKKSLKLKNRLAIGSDNYLDEFMDTNNGQQNPNYLVVENNYYKQIQVDKQGKRQRKKTQIPNSKLQAQRKSLKQGQDRLLFNQLPQYNSRGSIKYNLLREQNDQAQQIIISQRENEKIPMLNIPYLVIPQNYAVQNKQYNLIPELLQNNKRASLYYSNQQNLIPEIFQNKRQSIFYKQQQNLVPESPLNKRSSFFYKQQPNLIPEFSLNKRASILQQQQNHIQEAIFNKRASMLNQQQFNINPEQLANKRASIFQQPQKRMTQESSTRQRPSFYSQQLPNLQIESPLSKNQQIYYPQLQGGQIVFENQQQQELIMDKMQDFKYYYPAYNSNSIISLYNKVRAIQTIKFPPYFNVYSFVIRNSKNVKKLRSLPFQQSKKKIIIQSTS